ncbi:D-Ala-D-Ala carboxypeptidase family metallohydrolase [Kordiimonas sp.]|uniref:D-Ala-D-Ala carboxypeptidase family metallohydrolase n=1 Tax=Kordiimonas sp. TaxID=1970157 RepID=UPI003A8E9569
MTVGIHPRMEISPSFRLCDFTASRVADRYGLYNLPRDVSIVANLKALSKNVLEVIISRTGKHLTLLSGYRSVTLNRLLGGPFDSPHVFGEGVDFLISGTSVEDAALMIAAMDDLPFDTLVHERRQLSNGDVQAWLHLSHKRLGPNRGAVQTALTQGGTRTLNDGLLTRNAA